MSGACSKNSKKIDNPVVIPDGFSVMFGAGGGFAGLWNGYTVQADGSVLQWKGRYAEERTAPAGELSPEQMQILWTCLDKHQFFAQDLQDYGNQTAVIRVTTAVDTHRVAWRPVVRESKEAWTPLDSLYFQMEEIVGDRSMEVKE
jgi:hypothetical protein